MVVLKSASGRYGAWLFRLLWIAIACLTASALWRTASAQTAPPPRAMGLSQKGAPVAAATPYTVVLQESERRPSGEAAPQSVMTIALRADGAFVRQFEYHNSLVVIQRSVELPDGVNVVLDDVRERRTAMVTKPGTSVRARMNPAQGCLRNDAAELVFSGEIVGRERIDVYDTVKVQMGSSTSWFAPELGCAELKSVTLLSEGVVNEKIATLIVAGEPDSALFAIPDRYSEVPPSVFYELNPDAKETRAIDRSYYSRRPKR